MIIFAKSRFSEKNYFYNRDFFSSSLGLLFYPKSLRRYCQQAGFTEEEMDIICQPLVAAMRRSWLQLVFRGTLVLIVLGTLACLAAQLDFVGTHFTALSRLLLIKVLPIWNWQPLYYENCMINNPFYNDYTITEEDCVVCSIFLG